MSLNGIDIASYQKTLVPAQMTTTDFIIIKATQGNSYLNPTFKTQYQQAKAAGKLLGIYHYIDGSGADAEANYFINAVKSVGGVGEAILAVDEQSNQNSQYGNVSYVKQLMDKIYSLTGVKPFLYISHSIASKYNNIANAGYPLWGAQYANYNQTNYQSSPWRDGKNWGNWGADPTIRQYSSSGRIPGYTGNLDLDLFYGTKEDWKKYAKSSTNNTTANTNNQGQVTTKVISVNFSDYYNKVSNSGGDERWGIRGGAAGDQTGHEWEIKNWYSYPWNCVLRYPDANVRELIAELAIEAANNNNIGYDQGQRDTFWQRLQENGYRPKNIKTGCESDCSAGVIALTKSAGYLLNISALKNVNATYTGNMRTGFKNAGFQVLTNSKYLTSSAYLVPGDILLNDNNHVCTNLGIGSSSGYKQSSGGTVTTTPQTTVSYNTKEVQTMLNAAGWNLDVDGVYGSKTNQAVRDFQTMYRLPVTGAIDANTLKILKEVYGYIKDGFDAVYYSNKYSDLKKAFGTDKKALLQHYWEYGRKENRQCKKPAAAASTPAQTNPKPAQTTPAAVPVSKGTFSTNVVRKGKITAHLLNIRTQPTIHSRNLISYPTLKYGTIIGICMQAPDEDGDPWYYIEITGNKGTKYGFASASYIQLI